MAAKGVWTFQSVKLGTLFLRHFLPVTRKVASDGLSYFDLKDGFGGKTKMSHQHFLEHPASKLRASPQSPPCAWLWRWDPLPVGAPSRMEKILHNAQPTPVEQAWVDHMGHPSPPSQSHHSARCLQEAAGLQQVTQARSRHRTRHQLGFHRPGPSRTEWTGPQRGNPRCAGPCQVFAQAL